MSGRIPSDGNKNGADRIIHAAAQAALHGGQLAGGKIINPNGPNPQILTPDQQQVQAQQQAQAQAMAQIMQQLKANMMKELEALSTSQGASLQGWAMLVEQGVLTKEQCFNFLFKQGYGYPKQFGGDPAPTPTPEPELNSEPPQDLEGATQAPQAQVYLSIHEETPQEQT